MTFPLPILRHPESSTSTMTALVVKQHDPPNAEPDLAQLVQYAHTPEHLVYLRNHGPFQNIRTEDDEENAHEGYLLTVDGAVETPFKISFSELSQLPQTTVEAVLQCAGNRRSMIPASTDGIQWGAGTVANCLWSGVALSTLLERAGVRSSARHVHFAAERGPVQEERFYAGSVPLDKGLKDVLLATHMNGKKLSREHGAPLRVVVPGYCGARWVKWVTHIHLSPHESANHYMQRDYKVLPPSVKSGEEAENGGHWDNEEPITEMPLNSAIASISASSSSSLTVKGYALPGPGEKGSISRVEVSLDDGSTWSEARITYRGGRWGWVLWEYQFDSDRDGSRPGKGVALSRAVDEEGKTQPREGTWNLRGVCYDGYGRMEYSLE